MGKWPFFDCNCMLGRPSVPSKDALTTREEIEAELVYCGIEDALVFHYLARDYDPAVGNARLLEEIEGHPCFHPGWVVLPDHTEETPDVEEMLSKGVKAARMYPKAGIHGFSLQDWCAGNVLGALEAHRVPLFLDLEQTDWNEVYELCARHPHLPVVITNLGYRINRHLYPLFAQCEHLCVEVSGYQGHAAIEDVCRKYGAHHLLYGSRLPLFSPGATMALIAYANISDAQKRMIAGDNLRNMLEEVR